MTNATDIRTPSDFPMPDMHCPATAVPCPPWCDSHECSGEHWQGPAYLPASGRAPYVRPDLGTVFPAVGVGLSFSPSDGDIEPSVVIHLTGYALGRDLDENVFLRPHEAEAVARELLDRVAVLRRTLGGAA